MDVVSLSTNQETGISKTLTDQKTRISKTKNKMKKKSISIDALLTNLFYKTQSMSIMNPMPKTQQTHERNMVLQNIKSNLLFISTSYGFTPEIDSAKPVDCFLNQAKFSSFYLYSKGIGEKRNGNANVKFSWFFGSKDELKTVLSDGFCLPPVNGAFGFGICLTPFNLGGEILKYASADENGFKHLLLCRVILGKSEVVSPGSTQYKPSSDEFDSGVDDLVSPKKYIVWNGNVNTHILPEFIFSLKAPFHHRGPPRVPKSNRKQVADFIKDLSKFLPADAIELISKHYKECKKQKITRNELVGRMRQIAGDELLRRITKAFWKKQPKKHKQNKQKELEFVNELMGQFSEQLNL